MIVSHSMGVNRPSGGLSPSSVVGAFDPGNDGDAQLVAGGPSVAAEHVALQQREERLMAALSAAEPTWPIEPTMSWRVSARCIFLDRN
jgi:hypothetical protein